MEHSPKCSWLGGRQQFAFLVPEVTHWKKFLASMQHLWVNPRCWMDLGFFVPPSLVQAESFSEEEHLRILFWGAVLVSKHNYLSVLGLRIVMGFCCPFPSSHFQPSLMCLKTQTVVFKSLILLINACPLLTGVQAGLGKRCPVPGITCSSGRFLTRSPAKEPWGSGF